MILIRGASGFIGSDFVFDWFKQRDELDLDLLTHAGKPVEAYNVGRCNEKANLDGVAILGEFQPRADL